MRQRKVGEATWDLVCCASMVLAPLVAIANPGSLSQPGSWMLCFAGFCYSCGHSKHRESAPTWIRDTGKLGKQHGILDVVLRWFWPLVAKAGPESPSQHQSETGESLGSNMGFRMLSFVGSGSFCGQNKPRESLSASIRDQGNFGKQHGIVDAIVHWFWLLL